MKTINDFQNNKIIKKMTKIMIRQNDKRRFGTALENLISNPHTKPTFRKVKRGKKRKKKKRRRNNHNSK